MLKFSVHTDLGETVGRRLSAASKPAEHAVATQAAKDTSPFVPFLTGSLDQRTLVEGSLVIYPGPYAGYLYRGKVMVDAATGKGPMRIIGENGAEIIRFRRGATLKPTDRDLKFNKAGHRLAQSYWFEASKAQNLEKWLRVAGKTVKNGIQ